MSHNSTIQEEIIQNKQKLPEISSYYDYLLYGINETIPQNKQQLPEISENQTMQIENNRTKSMIKNNISQQEIIQPPFYYNLFNWYGIVLLFIILMLYLLFSRKKKNKKGNNLYIAGESNSGKTALIYELCTGNFPETCSSLQPNNSIYKLERNGKQIFIPIIDNPGHHPMRQNIYQNLENSKAIILMIDSTDKERLKFSRRAVSDDNEEIDDYLKLEDQSFNFQEKEIQICECSVKEKNLSQIINFIGKVFD